MPQATINSLATVFSNIDQLDIKTACALSLHYKITTTTVFQMFKASKA